MIRILKYTEYVYLLVAVLSVFKIVALWETGGQRLWLFVFFFVISLGMFFFRRHMRQRINAHVKDKAP